MPNTINNKRKFFNYKIKLKWDNKEPVIQCQKKRCPISKKKQSFEKS